MRDGSNICLWLDWWQPDCVLYTRYGYRVINDAIGNIEAKVGGFKDKTWVWRPARSEDLVAIQSKLPMMAIGSRDRPIWILSKSGSVSSSET